MSLEELRSVRVAKLESLKKAGIDAFPLKINFPILEISKIKKDFKKNLRKKGIGVAGRIMAKREHGGSAFLDLYDGFEKLQIFIGRDKIGVDSFKLFSENIDVGDFIAISGRSFYTKRKEPTIEAARWQVLAKSLRPLPEKWHGLSDVEERFRKRYLDLLSNPEVKRRFEVRSKVVTEIRKILAEAGYLEVETPALQPLYGGASAEPFVTHHNALHVDLYLRISDELYFKRLLAAGFPKVYEIARDFRNEGIDTTHNPEFTMLEFYEAYSDATKQREFVENIIRRLALLVNSDGVITFGNEKIDFSKPFKVKEYPEISDEEFKKTVKPSLIQPTFLIDYPVDMLPLTKRKEDNPSLADAFQLYAGGLELVKAFSELNDPIDQRARFESQEKSKEGGDKEAQPLDEDFLEAMEYGIPPAGGVGLGIDRLVMLLTDVKNIKEVILFPTLKPKI